MTETQLRRYLFKLYLKKPQDAALHEQRMMMADLWNALLSMCEERMRRGQQRQTWIDDAGKRHRGATNHEAEPWHLTKYTMGYWIKELHAECPEWRALSTWCSREVAAALYKSFKAFFNRAKAGAGAQSGYPRYRARVRSTTIPHRHNLLPGKKSGSGSGCRLAPRARAGADAVPDAGSAHTWSLTIKGVPGVIRAKGEFPAAPLDYKDANIIWRDNAWWLSICVEMAPRQTSGTETLMVRLDLIDEFARVERVEGQRLGLRRECSHSSAKSEPTQGDAGSDERVAEGWLSRAEMNDADAGSVERGRIASSGERGIDRFQTSRGALHLQAALAQTFLLMERVSVIKSERDKDYPRRPFQRPSWRYRRETRRAARLSTKATRIRREALHCWSTDIVGKAKDLTIVSPVVKAATASPRGDANHWGAAVAPVSDLNRNTLNQAPALAISMLTYKAKEAGIRCDAIVDETPKLAIAEHLVKAVKTHRRLRQKIKRIAA